MLDLGERYSRFLFSTLLSLGDPLVLPVIYENEHISIRKQQHKTYIHICRGSTRRPLSIEVDRSPVREECDYDLSAGSLCTFLITLDLVCWFIYG